MERKNFAVNPHQKSLQQAATTLRTTPRRHFFWSKTKKVTPMKSAFHAFRRAASSREQENDATFFAAFTHPATTTKGVCPRRSRAALSRAIRTRKNNRRTHTPRVSSTSPYGAAALCAKQCRRDLNILSACRLFFCPSVLIARIHFLKEPWKPHGSEGHDSRARSYMEFVDVF